ncbi:aldehyde dehydrogenase family protein [Aneurinibacillus migulanus]|uniref:aldehyde dehydrogenase family protein n=1 Tax=Aneurinibacillus migulanus TaxID=47500 RepID=UPI00209EA264|nr:aldehyde dehydrogenase family protein [Aneurinibacillus migulanus]
MIKTEVSPTVSTFLQQEKRLLIGGEWVPSLSGKKIPAINPADGKVLTYFEAGNEEDVNRAVEAARKAFETGEWPAMTPLEREKLLWKMAEIIEQHADELAELETLDNGKPISNALNIDVAGASNVFRYYAGWPTKLRGETNPVSRSGYLNYTMREPVGVVGQIIPWNYPLMMASWKLAPALAAGTTIILKPAEQTSLSALRLGELLIEAGVPAGVINIITGTGAEAGTAISSHPGIDKVAFTGSTTVGQQIMTAGSSNIKKISLELGGKSPNIIFADADIGAAAIGAAEGIFYNMGQDCTAGSRVFVQREVYEEVVEKIVSYAKELKIGYGTDPSTQIGPIVSARQLDRVMEYVQIGVEEGARLLTGGNRVTKDSFDNGYFIEPAVFADVKNTMRIAQEEIFGPVVTIIPFENENTLINQANDSIYGLGAGIWTRDVSKAHSVAKQLKAGMVWINSYGTVDPAAPFGGYKMSGNGREMGEYAMELYTEIKSVWVKIG